MKRFRWPVLLGILLTAIPAVAWAQTTPTPTVTAPDTPTTTSVPGNVPQIPARKICAGSIQPPITGGYVVPDPTSSKGFKVENEMQACHLFQGGNGAQAKSFMDSLLPDTTGSKFPMSAYDIGFSSSPSNWVGVIFGIATNALFTAAVWIVTGGLWLISWAMQFPFASIGGKVANEVNGLLQTRIVGPLGLGHFALFLCAVVAALHLLRGRAGKAVTEVATAMAALMIASFILGNPGAILRSAFKVEQDITSTLLSLGANTSQSSPAGTNPTLGPLKQAVVQADVAKPYDLINWGKILTGRCAAIRDEALSLGPWGDADAPRDTMKQAPECADAASFNESGSVNRLAASALNLLNAVVSVGLLSLVGLVSLVAQLGAVGLLAIAVLALLAALVPKVRSAAWRWVEAALRVQLVIIVSAFVLSFWAILVTAVLDQMAGAPLFLNFLVMICMTILSIIMFLGALRRAPNIARNVTKSFEGKDAWVSSKNSHGGAFGLGLGALGLSDAEAMRSKMSRLMPGAGAKKIVKALKGANGKGEAASEFDPASVPFPSGPGAMVLSDGPWGDGKWHAGAQHVNAERVPPRTNNATTRDTMDEAQHRLANPYTRPTIVLPETNGQKILTVGQRALPPGGSQTPPVPASRLVKCGGCGANIFTVPGAACPLCGHRN